MKIAILGWGSLVWDPKNLEFDTNFGWKPYGPFFMVEFARISKDGRLTLVLTEDGNLVKTLYTISTHSNLNDAVTNLAEREGCNPKSIGSYNRLEDKFSPANFPFKELLQYWLDDFLDIDAVIWTNLPEKWEAKRDNGEIIKVNPDERVEYLKNLDGEQKTKAEEYIRKTPPQILTEYRNLIEQELGWYNPVSKRKQRIKLLEEKIKVLKFENVYGTGIISCNDCGYSENIIGFIHGYDSKTQKRCAKIGHQCIDCGKFDDVYNIEQEKTFHKNCECGGELKRDEPLFCPKCKTYNVEFKTKFL